REKDEEAFELALLDEVHGDEPAKVLPGDLVGSGRGRSRARPAPEIEKRAGYQKKSATRRRGDPDVHPRALALRSLAEDVAWSRDLELLDAVDRPHAQTDRLRLEGALRLLSIAMEVDLERSDAQISASKRLEDERLSKLRGRLR